MRSLSQATGCIEKVDSLGSPPECWNSQESPQCAPCQSSPCLQRRSAVISFPCRLVGQQIHPSDLEGAQRHLDECPKWVHGPRPEGTRVSALRMTLVCTPGPPSSFPEARHDPPQHPNPCAPSCASLRSAAWWRARTGSPVGDCPGCTESSAGLKSIKIMSTLCNWLHA